MATERVGEAIDHEGPLLNDGGIVIPFEFKSIDYRLKLTDDELDALAARSVINNGLALPEINISTLDRIYLKPQHVIAEDGPVRMVASLYSFTDNPFMGKVFKTDRVAGAWSLEKIEDVPHIDMITWCSATLARKSLEDAETRNRMVVSDEERELLKRGDIETNKTHVYS